MKRLLILTILALSWLAAANSAVAFTYWNDARASALLPDDTVVVRVENPQGAGLVNTILYSDGGVQEIPLTPVTDGPSTLEATVPGPVIAPREYGFRLVQENDIDLLPLRVADGGTPTLPDLTTLSTDPVGDETTGRINLDLIECRIGRDSTRLYAALTNAGGGFPVSSGLTFFSYLLGIKNPAVADPDTLFAMIHTVDVAGIIAPGLYMIYGTGTDDLDKIGEITATEIPASNTLILSCLLSDLESNPVFGSWYDVADPRLDVAGFTQRITLLGGVTDADETPGGVWHLRQITLEPGVNQLPQLTDLSLPTPGPGARATVDYADADGNCPVTAELILDGNDVYPLFPQTLDYTTTVTYQSAPDLEPLVSGSWTEALVRFSDNTADVVELAETNVSAVGPTVSLEIWAAPNPFSTRTEFFFAMAHSRPVDLAVFDVAGRRVATLLNGTPGPGSHSRSWDGRDHRGRPQPSGVYFYRLRSGEQDVVRRLTLVR